MSDSPLGSPVAVSPHLVTFAELAARRREIIRAGPIILSLAASISAVISAGSTATKPRRR